MVLFPGSPWLMIVSDSWLSNLSGESQGVTHYVTSWPRFLITLTLTYYLGLQEAGGWVVSARRCSQTVPSLPRDKLLVQNLSISTGLQ